MPDTPSIVVTKSFTYRGTPELWSNRYHFSGDTPANAAEWKALADAIWAEERKALASAVTISAAYGYVAGNNVSVFQVNYLDPPNVVTAGTVAPATNDRMAPGDASAWIRWKTDERGTTGKPIYLRKYFHGVYISPPDTIGASTRTALLAFGAKMTDGTLPGSFRVVGPQGAAAGVVKVPTYITTRTLKRRGADPT